MLQKAVVAAALVLMAGAAFLALAPFGTGAGGRCGAPLLGAETKTASGDGPSDQLEIPMCGDEGVRRLVYATGLFFLGSTATAVVAVSVIRQPAREGEVDGDRVPGAPAGS